MVQVTGAAQLKLYGLLNGQLMMNVLGCEITGNPVFGQALADTLGTAIKNAWVTNMQPRCTSGVSLVRVGIRNLNLDNQNEYRDAGAAVVGNAVGDSLPGQNALVVSLRADGAGKSFRGRVYIGGFAEAENTATGVASANATTAAGNFVGAINTALQASSMRLAILTLPQPDIRITKITTIDGTVTETRTLSHQTQKPGAFHRVAFISVGNTVWDTQRRRNNSRGAPPTLIANAFSMDLP